MNILALDTSGPTASAALWRDGEIVGERFLNGGLTHSQTILPAAEGVLADAGLSPARIDLFACVVGPGSFTGVRIGVCAARGMAHATGKPCAAVNALEALAHGACGFGGVVCPLLDARRDQVYAAAFAPGETPERLMPDQALALDEYLRSLPEGEPLLFLGEAAPLHGEELRAALGARAKIAPAHLLHVRAAVAADLAARLPRSQWLGCEGLLPLYLRAPSAQRERERAGRARA